MAEIKAVHGKDKILKFRILEDASKVDGAKLALQTEHEWSYERDNNSTMTKDGSIQSDSGLNVTLDISAVSSRDEVNLMLFRAVKEGKLLEVWEYDLASEESGQFDTTYARGYLSSWTVPDSAEDLEELSTTMNIEGVPVTGKDKLTEEEINRVNAAYDFRGAEKISASSPD